MTAAIAERLPATFELAFAAMFVATLIAVTYVAMNLLTDLAYGLLDPRIRFD